MGEEKPDEELMGKRKSSPRLSTTFGDVDNLSLSGQGAFIPPVRKFCMIFFVFHSKADYGTISTGIFQAYKGV